MKELKIFAVVAAFSLILYWGVEPFAHSQMHKHVEGHGFTYSELKVDASNGNAENGKALIGACVGCHSIKSQNIPAPLDPVASATAYGVNPPDLSDAGTIYDEKFLVDLMKNPAHALKLEHKFDMTKGQIFPMPQMVGDDQSAADIVAYLKSIAHPIDKVTPQTAFENACGRCHAVRYDEWTQIGFVPKTKSNIATGHDIDALKFQQNVATYQNRLAEYMGKLPPDLSIIIRARSKDFLETFVEDPQSQLPGTAMPRVGLSKEGYKKVEAYLEEVGDPSKSERERLGPWVLGFFFIFVILAYIWKRAHWNKLH